jgi:hypothetical protein
MIKVNSIRAGIRVAIIFLLSLIFIESCKHEPEDLQSNHAEQEDEGDDEDSSTPIDTIVLINPHPCDSDSVYFTNTILPLITSYCATSDCHDAINPEQNLNLTDYSHIRAHVQPGSLNGSAIWLEGIQNTAEPMPPYGEPQLTVEQKNLIRQWILQGAKNNSCQADCNPGDSSYTNNLAPIIELYCAGCHGGSNPSDGISMENITELRSAVNNNQFIDALSGTNGVELMPPNSTGLPDCYKEQFQNWINAGMPDN